MSATESELRDPALLGEVDLARAAAQEEAGDEEVGAHVGTHIEADTAVTHLFEAVKPGYHGWRWAVTVASAGPDTDVTISEVVLLPGPEALVAPDWVPWENRVQAGDLGVGDLLPTAPDDPRLVPAYIESDDPAVEEVARDAGLGRPRVMARPARLDAATRWQHSEFGPRSDMARSAPAHCGTCGFYLPLAGSLRAAFGTCGNEISPADGHVVHTEYGCGAHSEAEVEQVSPVLVANLIYDDAELDVEPLAPAETDEAPAEPEEPAAKTTEAATAPTETAAEAADAAIDAAAEAALVEADAAAAPAEAAEALEAGPAAEAAPIEAVAAAPAAATGEATPVEAPPAEAAVAKTPPAETTTEAPAAERPPAEAATAEAPADAATTETVGADAAATGEALEAGPATEPSPPREATVTGAEISTEAQPAEAPSEEASAEKSETPTGDEVEPELSLLVESIAPPRELPGPGSAAEGQLPFPAQDGPPAAEPVAPLEAVVTAETAIDAPGEARAGETTTEPDADAADDHGTAAETEAPNRAGLLTGGLLDGGLLSGGLLRNGHTLTEVETPDQGATTDEPAELGATRENEASAQADVAADMPDQSHTPSTAEAPDQSQIPGDTEAAEQTVAPSAAEVPDHNRAPGGVETPDHDHGPGDAETPSQAGPGETEAPDQSHTSGDAETPGESAAPDHSHTPGDTETPGSDVEAQAEEHHPWQPSFRPYWMRSADERRTEGD